MHRKNAVELVQGVISIASLPSIYFRLRDVVADTQTSSQDVAQVISDDPGLTARLLRIVNSAHFGFPSKIDTVTRAITIIGSEQLCELVLATSVINMFKNLPQDLINMDSFWRHSLACAMFSRLIANKRKETNLERFFVAGLLHDIGRLILYSQNSLDARDAMEKSRHSGELLYVTEQIVMGYNHSSVGGALLSAWSLPKSLQEPVQYHHFPKNASHAPIETATVHLADILANALQFGTSGERYVPNIVPEAWNILHLQPESISEIIEEVEANFEDTVKMLLGDNL